MVNFGLTVFAVGRGTARHNFERQCSLNLLWRFGRPTSESRAAENHVISFQVISL